MDEFEEYKSWIENVECNYSDYAFSSLDIKYLDGTNFSDHYKKIFSGSDIIKMHRNKYRTPFQLERDRILYSLMFQRLADKTQLFTSEKINFIENRHTHSLKVMQISRSIARGLKLNEDLVETIALGHDIGHPPFAHIGENALEEWIKEKLPIKKNVLFKDLPILETITNSKKNNREKVKEYFTLGNDPKEKFFMHGRQGFRLLLKQKIDFFRFSKSVMYGIWRHSIKNFNTDEEFYFFVKIKEKEISLSGKEDLTLEAQVVRYADDIAWVVSDLQEGFHNKILKNDQIKEIMDDIYDQNTTLTLRIKDIFSEIPIKVSELLTIFISDIIENNMKKFKDAENSKALKISFSEDINTIFEELKKFIKENLHNKYFMARGSQVNKERIKALCNWYFDNPNDFLSEIANKMKETTFPLNLKIKKLTKKESFNYSNDELYENLFKKDDIYKITIIVDFISVLTDHEVYRMSETMPTL